MIAINVIIDDRMQDVKDALDRSKFANLQHGAERIVERARLSILPAKVSTTEAQTFGERVIKLLGSSRTHVFERIEHAKRGEPPRTMGIPRHNLRDAITSNRPSTLPEVLRATGSQQIPDNDITAIGTLQSDIGDIGAVMEFGGEYKGQTFAPHPYLWPAFRDELDSVAQDWAGSIGE